MKTLETNPTDMNNGILGNEAIVIPDVPDIKMIIDEAILASDIDDDNTLVLARRAESRREMNPELEGVVDTIIGIKLIGIRSGEERLIVDAERIFNASFGGDKESQQIATSGLYESTVHDSKVRQIRRSVREQYFRENGYDEKRIKELTPAPEELGYEQLAIVHVTDHEPVRQQSDGELHILDRFSSDGLPRPTIHTALNHMVESSTFSSDWSDKRVIVVAPMDEVVEINGEPTSLIGHDTWWETPSHKGLVVPDSAIIIKPGASRPIQVLSESREIRYKIEGITAVDATELIAMASDYELSTIAQSLGIRLHLTGSSSNTFEKLKGTSLAQYRTNLTDRQKQDISKTLINTLDTDRPRGMSAYAVLAKRVAVRLALTELGREVIEPLTIMDSNFKSSELNTELNALATERGMTGHHSESTNGMFERILFGSVDPKSKTVSESKKPNLIKFVREHVDELSRGTLHMCYRLGIL